MASQSSDPSQQQTYHYDYQQTQPPYYPQQPQYYPQPQSSYPYYPHYNPPPEDSSIHPPGVPHPQSSHELQNQQSSYFYYYPNGGIAPTPLQTEPHGHVHPHPIVQASNAVANGTGHSSSAMSVQRPLVTAHGQEHPAPFPQGTTAIPVPPSQLIQPSYGPTPSISNNRVKAKGRKTKSQPPCQPARCELCKVDCNSLEIFEQHKSGKKHQKNLKAHKELQTPNKVMVEVKTEIASASEHKPEIPSQSENVEGSNDKHLPLEASSCVAVGQEVKTGEQKAIEADSTEESAARKRKSISIDARGNGSKRKIRNGKALKWVRSEDGSKRPVEPPKPKAVPLICELCNVTCESPMVFQAHLNGKKHLANLKRFQGEQAVLGQAAVQAIYPALQALYPALQALCQGDITTLISQLQQQGFLGVQGQPGSSSYFQGQGSQVPPAAAAITEIQHPSVFPQQQSDFPPQGLGTPGAATISEIPHPSLFPQQQSNLPPKHIRPATVSETPHSSVFPQQQSDFPPQGLGTAQAATISEIPHPSVLPQQQSDLPPKDLGTAGELQVVTLTDCKSDEQPGPIPEPEIKKDAESELLEGK